MADPKNDITTSIEANDADVTDLKKAHYQEAGMQTRIAAPAGAGQQPAGLSPELVNMLTLGKRYAQFQGIDRCIRILENGTANQRHCGSMMVKNLTTNMLMCSNCDKIRDPNSRPVIINSSMIRLSQKELEECGLKDDPLLNAQSAAKPAPQPKKVKVVKEHKARSPKMAVPNKVKIEITMSELQNNPNIVETLLTKTLESIFDLPVKNFREAEEIRVVKERVEQFLKEAN